MAAPAAPVATEDEVSTDELDVADSRRSVLAATLSSDTWSPLLAMELRPLCEHQFAREGERERRFV